MDELDLLDNLLAEHEEITSETNENEETNADKAIHSDSSEEEEERNCFERKYSDKGLEIRKTLNEELDNKTRKREERQLLQDKARSTWGKGGTGKLSLPNTCDFMLKGGIRIVKPLVNETTLYERINNRTILTPSNCSTSEKEIVLMGIVHNCDNRVSAAGNNYTLCVLTDFYKTVQVFLFGQAKNSIKGQIGIAIAVLNPSIMKGSGNDTRFSVDEAARIMVIGGAKDWGRCQATTKAGAPCTSAVNISQCRFCVHHMAAEYRKASKKSSLTVSSLKQRLMGSMRPVPYKSDLGKTATPIRSGFVMNVAQKKKDLEILKALSGNSSREIKVLDNKPLSSQTEKQNLNKEFTNSPFQNRRLGLKNSSDFSPQIKKQSLENLDSSSSERLKDKDLNNSSSQSEKQRPILKNSSDFSPQIKKENLTTNSTDLSSQKQNMKSPSNSSKKQKLSLKSPNNLKNADFSPQTQKSLQKSTENSIDSSKTQKLSLKSPNNSTLQNASPNINLIPQPRNQNLNFLTNRQKNARLQAAKLLSNLKNSNEKPTLKPISEPNEEFLIIDKKAEFNKLLNTQSAHMELLNAEEDQKVAEYFSNLETKERLEEKMSNTYKIECRAVSCKQCGYRAFSSAERCRKEGHTLTVTKAFKRFFKCLDCSRRTTSLTILPEGSCSNCGGSRWKRAALLDEKKTNIGPTLSLRGDEEMYIGSAVETNVNLLVPESQ